MSHHPDPTAVWSVDELQFPTAGTDSQKLTFAVRYAILAPSSHNTQPWQFVLEDGGLEVRADRQRCLPVVDPDDRELTISCGAALGVLRIALAHFGYATLVEPAPPPAEEALAKVRLAGPVPFDPDVDDLFRAIPLRRTNRRAFDPRPVPDTLAARLGADAEGEDAWLHIVGEDAARHALVDLVAEADHVQLADRRFRRELAAWIRTNDSDRPDGIRGYGLGMRHLMSHVGPFVLRTFDVGKGQAARDRELAEHSPLLAVLGTEGDTEHDWLAAGQALVRVLLRARAEQVSGAFLNQPVEVAEMRPRLAALVGRPDSHPQLVLRLGYGPDPAPEPRRSADEVTVVQAGWR